MLRVIEFDKFHSGSEDCRTSFRLIPDSANRLGRLIESSVIGSQNVVVNDFRGFTIRRFDLSGLPLATTFCKPVDTQNLAMGQIFAYISDFSISMYITQIIKIKNLNQGKRFPRISGFRLPSKTVNFQYFPAKKKKRKEY